MMTKTLAILIVSIVAQAVGNTCLSKGMKEIAAAFDGASGFSMAIMLPAAMNPLVLMGTLLLIIFFILFAVALSWADLSFVQPATAFGYILNVMLARQFLDEPISAAKWGGTALIVLGVFLLSRSATSQLPDAMQRSLG